MVASRFNLLGGLAVVALAGCPDGCEGEGADTDDTGEITYDLLETNTTAGDTGSGAEFPYALFEAKVGTEPGSLASCVGLQALEGSERAYLPASLGLAAKYGLMYVPTSGPAEEDGLPMIEAACAEVCAELSGACSSSLLPRRPRPTGECPTLTGLDPVPGAVVSFSCSGTPAEPLNVAQYNYQTTSADTYGTDAEKPPYAEGLWVRVDAVSNYDTLWYGLAYGLFTFKTATTLVIDNDCGELALGIYAVKFAVAPSSARDAFAQWLQDPTQSFPSSVSRVAVYEAKISADGRLYTWQNGAWRDGAHPFASTCETTWWRLAENQGSSLNKPFGIIDPVFPDEATATAPETWDDYLTVGATINDQVLKRRLIFEFELAGALDTGGP